MKRIIGLIGTGLLLSGCATSAGDYSWAKHTWTTDHGIYALDHVSGKKVELSRAVQRPCLGEIYYFENEADARVFDSNPWGYLYSECGEFQSPPNVLSEN